MKETRTMWEILEDSRDLENQLIENEGELTPELQELININENELLDKIEKYYYVIQNLTNKAELEKSQKDRFAKRQKTLENSAERLKEAVNMAMSRYGITDLKSKAKIPSKKLEAGSVIATAISYPILDPTTIPPIDKIEEEIPAIYLDYTVTIKLNQNEAKLLEKAVKTYNDKVGSKEGIIAFVPEFQPNLNTESIKSALKDGEIIGDLKLLDNYKTRFK